MHTRKEVAEILGFPTVDGVRALERAGKLKGEKGEDGKVRFHAHQVEAVRAERATKKPRAGTVAYLEAKEEADLEAEERAEERAAAARAERERREDAEETKRMMAENEARWAKQREEQARQDAERKAKKQAEEELKARTFDDWEVKKQLGLGYCHRREIDGFVEDGLLTPIRCHDAMSCARETLHWEFCYCPIRYDKAEVQKFKETREQAARAIVETVNPESLFDSDLKETVACLVTLRDLMVFAASLKK
jgi:flagellar biosynthesis GTPase FlhF